MTHHPFPSYHSFLDIVKILMLKANTWRRHHSVFEKKTKYGAGPGCGLWRRLRKKQLGERNLKSGWKKPKYGAGPVCGSWRGLRKKKLGERNLKSGWKKSRNMERAPGVVRGGGWALGGRTAEQSLFVLRPAELLTIDQLLPEQLNTISTRQIAEECPEDQFRGAENFSPSNFVLD